jgi:hypothetical protein
MTVQEFYADPTNWCQHALVNARGQRCLEGALILCYGDYTPKMIKMKRCVLRSIRAAVGCSWSLPAYNDRFNRRVEEVQALVKAANV